MRSISVIVMLDSVAQTPVKASLTGDARQILRTGTKQIQDFGKTCQWFQALQLFRNMLQQEVMLDMFTYSALISVCGKGRQTSRLLERRAKQT